MPSYIEKAESVTLPVIPLRGTVAFPLITVNFEAGEDAAAAAAKAAAQGSSFLFLTSYKEFDDGAEEEEYPFYTFGTVVRIKQMLRTPEGSTRIIAEGLVRATVVRYKHTGAYVEADLICKHISLPDHGGVRGEAAVHEMLSTVENNLRLLPANTEDLMNALRHISDPGALADFIAANVLTRPVDKQAILECLDPLKRAELLLEILEEEAVVMEEEAHIRRRVSARMNRNQREYYLREQIKVIQEELGEGDEVAEFAERIKAAKLPADVEAKLKKENDRLAKTPFGSAESTVLANYLDVCLSIPWGKTTHDRVSFSAVQRILDRDHNGLTDVKERIVEYIAAKQLNPNLNNQILCLVGPPGVGKTSIASSIAEAMNRKYVRISLGGVRDEADIRGHRKTYIGAMPGRIINAITQAGVCNPLILLDEIDKLSRDSHGDPTSALLEVLDGEQNKSFRDHFVELPFDLSDCMFIATANSLDTVPRPLLDRMEIIELSIYTKREKLEIAKDHLIPKQLKRHGMNKRMLRITDAALSEIIDFYTREAGVRNLERSIASLCRKAGKKMLAEELKSVSIGKNDVKTYLGERKLLPEVIDPEDEVGCVNGLAYTELGGSLLKVEVAVLDGSGKIETTGSLGDVMKESASLAVSFVRSVASLYGIPADFYKTKDLHIHFPEGAVPKDGPSAGVTMVTALISALSGIPVRRDVAMTGEISLRGNVLPIGGLKEKTMAAYNAGVKTVLIPADNLRDLEKIDPLARENLEFIPCKKLSEVLSRALLTAKAPQGVKEVEDTRAASKFIPLGTGHSNQIRFSDTENH
ncbi:MAG: endopeptidase La [Ruminococcaceae bacterium]|nr:endopeptidase La [Oscillospiraceae bacterium]